METIALTPVDEEPIQLTPVEDEPIKLTPVDEEPISLTPVEETPPVVKQPLPDRSNAVWESVGKTMKVEPGAFEHAFEPFPVAKRVIDSIIPSFVPETPEMQQIVGMAGLGQAQATAAGVAERVKGAAGALASPGGIVLGAAAPMAPEIVGPVMAATVAPQAAEGIRELGRGEVALGLTDLALTAPVILGGGLGMVGEGVGAYRAGRGPRAVEIPMEPMREEPVPELAKVEPAVEATLPAASETLKEVARAVEQPTTGEPNASEIGKGKEIHGVLLRNAQEGESAREVPVNEGQPGVRPKAKEVTSNRTAESIKLTEDSVPWGEQGEMSTEGDAQARIFTELSNAFGIRRALDMTSGKEPYPSLKDFQENIEAYYSREGDKLRASLASDLERLGEGKRTREIPSRDDFPTGLDYYRAMLDAGAKAKKLGSGLATDLRIRDPLNPLESRPETEVAAEPPPEEPPPTSPAAPAEGPVPQRIGISNARVDAQRAGRGEGPLMSRFAQSHPETWEKAMRMVEEEPGIAERLVSELQKKPRAVEAEESVVIERRLVELQNEFDQAVWDGIKAKDAGDEAAMARAKVRESMARDALEPVERVARDIGSKQGLALNARQILLRENFTYAGVERRMRAAKNYDPLTEAEQAHARAVADEWRKANSELLEKLAKRERELSEAKDAERLATLKAEAAEARAKVTGRVKAIVLKVGEALDAEANKARARLRGKVLSLSPEDMLDIGRIAAANLYHLGENLAAWSAKMVEEFGEGVKPHLEALWQKAHEILDEQAKARGGPKDGAIASAVARKALPEESRLRAYKTRLGNRIKDLEARLAARDFSRRKKSVPPVDPEIMTLRAKLAKIESDFEEGMRAEARAKRPGWVKVMDALAAWKRAMVLTSLGIFEKLTMAGALRQVSMPVEDIVGYGLKQIPGIDKIAAKAAIEGNPSLAATIKGLTEGWTMGLKDAWQKLSKGETDLDVLHGHRRPGFEGPMTKWGSVLEPQFLHYAGFTHAALKAPTFRNAYESALFKLRLHDAKAGLDLNDPMVQLRQSNQAYEWATRQIFLNDNRMVDAYRRFLNGLNKADEHGNPNPALKALSTFLQTEMPIVKVPTNIAAEAIEYMVGSMTGAWKAARALRDGVERLPPDQAEMIMRQLKKGALGLPATVLVGYFLRDQIGGFFLPNQRLVADEKKGLKPGSLQIGDVKVNEQDLHHPLMTALMFGATAGKVADTKLRKKDTAAQGIWNGLVASSIGLAETTPFGREIADAAKFMDPAEREKLIQQRLTSIVVPGGVSWIARHTDTDANGEPIRRKPRNLKEAFEMNIPGLRKEVPRAKDRR